MRTDLPSDSSFKPNPPRGSDQFRSQALQEKLVIVQKSAFSPRFYATLFFVGIGTFLVHEFAHWLTGVALGHDMVVTPNHVWSRNPMSALDQIMVSSAGPVITIAQGIVGFWLVKHRRSQFGFALLYMAFFMRLLAAGMSFLNPNDEAKVSQLLGLGTWPLPLIVVTGLFGLLISASRNLELRFRDQLFCYLVASIVVTLIVGADAALWRNA